jgi:hypothetical protein
VNGAFTGLGFFQSNAAARDRPALLDVSNATLFVQKTEGLLQFFVQAGAYGLPALGVGYAHLSESRATQAVFGAVPQAFAKIAPSENFSIQAGNLPSLIGAEYSFTFENVDIERGLLWGQAPAVSRGVQGNAILGKLAFSLSVNDGFYANRFGWLSGSASWTIDARNLLVFVAGANLAPTARQSAATPLLQNNSAIYNVIYSYSSPAWMVSPYVQYTEVTAHPAIGIMHGASTYGGAVLVTRTLSDRFSLGARAEYIASTGHRTNLLYGAGSSAQSLTLTPTYKMGRWFVRADFSAVGIGNAGAGDGFGARGGAHAQGRVMVEAGYLF